MKRLGLGFLVAASASFWLLSPRISFAHGGITMDVNGCHADARLHEYHCHRGELAGKHFPSRSEMLRMLETGEDTSVEPSRRGAFGNLGRIYDRDEDEKERQASQSAAPAAPSHGVAAHVAQPSIEERLATLKRLYERGLITKDEYDGKRRELLDSL